MLNVLSTRCPMCQTEPVMIVSDVKAFCDTEWCDVVTWDRTLTAEDNLAFGKRGAFDCGLSE